MLPGKKNFFQRIAAASFIFRSGGFLGFVLIGKLGDSYKSQ
jgi:hypothetical protein